MSALKLHELLPKGEIVFWRTHGHSSFGGWSGYYGRVVSIGMTKVTIEYIYGDVDKPDSMKEAFVVKTSVLPRNLQRVKPDVRRVEGADRVARQARLDRIVNYFKEWDAP